MSKQPKYLISKSNALVQMKNTYKNIQQQRLFNLYIAKINPLNPINKTIRITIAEFKQIIGLEENLHNIQYFKDVAKKVLGHPVTVKTEKGWSAFVLFQSCKLEKDIITEEWYFQMTASEEAMPYFFQLKNNYTKYELGSILSLKSVNQLRTYEILKQFVNIGQKKISLEDFRAFLSIKEGEYTDFNNFKRKVLNPCQEAMEKFTDIKYTYETIRGKGKGGKIIAINFHIQENKEIKKNIKKFLTSFIDIPNISVSSLQNPPISPELYTKQPYLVQQYNQDISSNPQKTPPKPHITYLDIENAKDNNLWEYAIGIATKTVKAKNIPHYAFGILTNWINLGYTTSDDLIKHHELYLEPSKDPSTNSKYAAAYNLEDYI
jgi:plasmid replication initiation protein